MAKYSSITPEGTGDLLYKECEARREIESKITDIFKSRGFSEVITPSLEFYDVFSNQFNAIPQEMMYKFIDSKGRILVMRPDNTMPIARLVSTRLKSYLPPLRLYYNQKVYRISPSMSGRSDEFTQCGIELIGSNGKKADLEVIATAITTLKKAADIDFYLEIGHVGFYKSIIDDLPFEISVIEQIRHFIETKNYASLSEILEPYVKEHSACKALLALPKLFGGNEVFELALSVAPNKKSIEIVEYLRELYTELCSLGFEKNIIIDLGLVNQIHYYSGVVFRGFAEGSGETVLSGGRYDLLLSAFGTDWPATGFAVNTDLLAKTIINRMQSKEIVLVHYEKDFTRIAYEYAENMIESGIICEMSIFDNIEKAKNYALKKGIKRIDLIKETIEIFRL